MASSDESLPSPPDPVSEAAGRIRRLSEAMAVARFSQLLDEAGDWVMWLGAAIPRARRAPPAGPLEGRDVAALREVSRGFGRWMSLNLGLLLAVGGEVARRADHARAAASACLREARRAGASFEQGRQTLEASLVALERAVGEKRRELRGA